MNLSPRSQEVIDELLREGSFVIGMTPFGPYAAAQKKALKILVDNYDELSGDKGETQAQNMLSLYIKEKAQESETQNDDDTDAVSPVDGNELQEEEQAPTAIAQQGPWRLTGLECESYRGCGAPGEVVKFPFDGRSALIYGPNGSGKSSLLGAVVWALTDKAITDSGDDDITQVPLLEPSAHGEEKGKKIKDWNVAATLPDGRAALAVESCRVELELSCLGSDQKLYVQRTLTDGLRLRCKSSEDWQVCSDLSDYGISPLDLQLSLIAPSMFGRVTVESAPTSGKLLALMLGLDDIETIGALAAGISRSRTALENKISKARGQAWNDFLESLKGIEDGLKEGSVARTDLEDFYKKKSPTLEDIEAIGKAIKGHTEKANESIAKALGLSDEQDVSETLAESLSAAVVELKKGAAICFPEFNKLDPKAHYDDAAGTSSEDWVRSRSEALDAFLKSSEKSINERLKWLRQKVKVGAKADLYLRASEFYEEPTKECPVCEEAIKNEHINSRLKSFKNLDPALLKDLQDYFRELSDQLKKIAPLSVQNLSAQSPKDRLTSDWGTLKETLGDDLSSIAKEYDSFIETSAKGIDTPKVETINLLPLDAEKEFVDAADAFVKACTASREALRLLNWGAQQLSNINDELTVQICGKMTGSLYDVLSKGISAAQDVGTLKRIRKILANAYTDRKAIAGYDLQIGELVSLKDALEPLKALEKNALAVVKSEFQKIKDDTLANWEQLYPEHTTGLSPANLLLDNKKDRKIYAYLGHVDYEVSGQYFANAGLQRAIALSFYFALLSRHPKGLGFIVMDDSIVSLDEDHRDSWSGNVLRPWMETFQFVFATHQKTYLKYHRDTEFSGELIVELNPRKNASCISWKPGHRIERAKSLISENYDVVPNILRKFIEELLITLECYVDTPFIASGNLSQSIENYQNYGAPFVGKKHKNIASILNNENLVPIVNAGSHGPTDHEVTEPLTIKQLNLLDQCWQSLKPEIERLEGLRIKQLRKRPTKPHFAALLNILTPANWNQPFSINQLGSAAAKGDVVLIDGDEIAQKREISGLSPVLVLGGSLDPVAKRGQWVLLGPDDETITEGCLAAILTSDGRRLLRRVWSNDDSWLMESINPVKRTAVEKVPMDSASLRKLAGVVFEPRQDIPKEALVDGAEWQESDGLTIGDVSQFSTIIVEGESLEPIAWKGQSVLMGEPTTVLTSTVSRGSLAILETKNDNVGNVIKRVFPFDGYWLLVSPNPVDPHDPIKIDCSDIVRVHPFRGTLFSGAD